MDGLHANPGYKFSIQREDQGDNALWVILPCRAVFECHWKWILYISGVGELDPVCHICWCTQWCSQVSRSVQRQFYNVTKQMETLSVISNNSSQETVEHIERVSGQLKSFIMLQPSKIVGPNKIEGSTDFHWHMNINIPSRNIQRMEIKMCLIVPGTTLIKGS